MPYSAGFGFDRDVCAMGVLFELTKGEDQGFPFWRSALVPCWCRFENRGLRRGCLVVGREWGLRPLQKVRDAAGSKAIRPVYRGARVGGLAGGGVSGVHSGGGQPHLDQS